MKKSNWREELNAPAAVKKTINEFVLTGGGALTIAKGLGLGTALKTVIGTKTGTAVAAGVTGAAVGSKLGKKKEEDERDGPPPVKHKVATTINPQ